MQLAERSSAKVLTLHPDPLICAGISACLHQHGGFEVIHEGPDGPSWHDAQIDVVIADYQQAMRLAGAVTPGARGSFASARILVLTSDDRQTSMRHALEAGIGGYLLLGGPLSELIEAVTALSRGVRYLGRLVGQRMVDSVIRTSLTTREMDVLQLVVAGEGNKAIARRLRIEVGTVKTHMNGILGKLEATSRTQAAAIAVAQGIVAERMPVPARAFAARFSRVEPMTLRA